VSSLYLHIPFCRCKCAYCSFTSFSGLDHLHARYVSALQEEIGLWSRQQSGAGLDTLFIGGGTPTVLAPELLEKIIGSARQSYGLSPEAEISIEANPGTVSLADLQSLCDSGVNRLSLGMQSFHDGELAALGRQHTAADSLDVFRQARQAGFTNISIDLMYGLPYQTRAGWQAGLEEALRLEPDHLSIYQLSIEPGTPFFERLQRGELALPGEDDIVGMDHITYELCETYGLERYEISNYCRPGFQCRHNLVYWRNLPYLGCGAGAVSYVDGVRSHRVPDPDDYCERVHEGSTVIEESEKLEPRATFKETVVMGLRLLDGVSEQVLIERFGFTLRDVYGDLLDRLIAEGWLEMREVNLCLTDQGLRFANRVMAELV
jgi:oxygen-independent coproporphyrinogen-3 oxidase